MHLQKLVTKIPKYHHQHIAKMELGHFLNHSGLTHSTVSSVVFRSIFFLPAVLQFLLSWLIGYDAFC
jgi:hypothetical protein